MSNATLVSIVIPAYKPQFFEKALISAMLQDYENVEIVVCDDCRTDAIAAIVERVQKNSQFPIRYFRNEMPLMEPGNLARGVREASGEFVKFLYDDDLLMPDAVRLLLQALQQYPGASLATARRRVIDEDDKPYGESLLTIFPFRHDVIIDGRELASFLGQYIYNFIGEPSSVMCRRADALALGAGIMDLDGTLMEWVGDLALYVKLLQQGDLVMLRDTLGCFRVSTIQTSQLARETPHVANEPYARFRAAIKALGWARPDARNGTVKVATLVEPQRFHDLHLGDYFVSGGVLPMGNDSLQAWAHPSAKLTPVKDWLAQRVLTPVQQRLVEQHRANIAGRACVAVIVLDCLGQSELDATCASLQDWAANHTTGIEQHTITNVGADSSWVVRLNEIVARSEADWVLILRAGDVVLPSGAWMLDQALANSGGMRLIYCDEFCRTRHDLEIMLRPEPNYDYLLSLPALMAGHWLMHRECINNGGGFDASLPGAIELDLILRSIEAQGLQVISHLAEPLLVRDAQDWTDNPDEVASITRHLRRRGYQDAYVTQEASRRYRISFAHAKQPVVSIILSACYPQHLLHRCVESVLALTRYPFFEILIIDHQPADSSVRSWLRSLRDMGAKLRVIQAQACVTLADAVNHAVAQAQGDYLVLLDSSAVVIQDDWLDQLLNHGLRDEVAIVAGSLVGADRSIRHTGLIGGLRGAVGPAFDTVKINQLGYMQRLTVDQNFSTLPSACMLVRKSIYQEVEGFDAALQVGQLGAADFCLRVARLGYLAVWTPHAMLLQDIAHDLPSKLVESDLFFARWLDVLANDPSYNPNCSLRGAAFELEPRVWLNWMPLKWRPLPVVLALPLGSEEQAGTRIITPFQALQEAGMLDGAWSHDVLNPAEVRRLDPQVVVYQDDLFNFPLDSMRQVRALSDAFVVLEVQAFLGHSPEAAQLDPQQRWQHLSEAASLADRVVVPTRALADAFAPLHSDIQVLETRLGKAWRDLPSCAVRQQRVRVGCAVEASTSLDPQLLVTLVEHFADRVDWVLWGDVSVPLHGLACEVHDGALQNNPQQLLALRLDLALAPLGVSGLDGCRSPLPLLQFGACGFPVICSDTPAYQNDLDVTRVANTPARWVEAISSHLDAPNASLRQAARLREQVIHEWIFDETSLAAWAKAWLAP
ncbi:glycosyltransferase [Pseudomonas sp. NPDC089395]|uniref:glycosyltransferase n=1 Tax=Pseudomonas sp. NPDC089395 TaxID=3364460 RepID=UPI00380C73E1